MNSPIKPLIITITGPSSSGKTVLSHDMHEQGFQTLVSTTTRPMRRGEKDGESYHFISVDAFEALEKEHALIESIVYDTNRYGISSHEAENAFAQGKSAALVVEPHGVEQVSAYCHRKGWEVLRVFVFNPTPVLVQRMLGRVIEDVQGVEGTPQVGKTEVKEGIARHSETIAQAPVGELPAVVKAAVEDILGFSVAEATGRDKIETYLTTHTNRMGKVLDFEQREWVKPAVSGQVHYDLIFRTFDESNRQAILAEVCAAAEKISAPEPESSETARARSRVRPG
jgi:guanylate kinase